MDDVCPYNCNSCFFHTLFPKNIIPRFRRRICKASGIPVAFFSYLLITLIALTVVLNIRVVGIILILSLLTIPQATANLFTKDFKKLLVLSVLFAFVGTITGLLISYFANIPSGATIIFTLIVIFGFLRLFKFFR